MKTSLLGLFLIFLFNFSDAQAYEVDTIQYVGHSENYYDIVILAEGYRDVDMEQFAGDAANVQTIMALNNAYLPMMDHFNIFAIRTPSIETGVSLIAEDPGPDDPIQVTDKKDTYFGIYFRNSYRAHFLDDTTQLKAKHVSSEHIPFYETALILVNDERVSGRADFGGIAVATKSTGDFTDFSAYVINHELAHSIGGLADTYSPFKEENFNKTTNNNPETIRWKHLLDSPEVYVDSFSFAPGVYFPNAQCMMNSAVHDYFCPVCHERITHTMSDVSKKMPVPYRVFLTDIDTAAYSQTYRWDAIPGATHYEVVYVAGWRQGLILNMTDTNQFTFNLSDEDFLSTVWIEGLSTVSWLPSIIVRAFNSETSSYFNYLSLETYHYIWDFPNEGALDVPVLESIVQTSPSSYRFSFTQDENLLATLIRIYNEDGNYSDIVTAERNIEIRGLIPGKTYQYKYAGIIPDNVFDGNSSDFSELFSTNSALMDFDGDGFTSDVDCDDLNAEINPGAIDIEGNGIDEDCDGEDAISAIHEIGEVSVSIYPNPANETVYIDANGQIDLSISLISVDGKVLFDQAKGNKLDVSNVLPGSYVLIVEDVKSGERILERIVISR